LQWKGLKNLGSNAKERKEGQCNVDFTMASVDEIFAEVDKRFWNANLRMLTAKIFSALKAICLRK
jgi:hypothetical protein